MKGPDGLCTDCGGTHDLWHAENPDAWEYREGCACYLCQEQERKMSRDTQFAGFAKTLWDELEQAIRQDFRGCIPEGKTRRAIYIPLWQKLIARRAYDLACHIVENVSAYNVSSIPDMTELPKEQE